MFGKRRRSAAPTLRYDESCFTEVAGLFAHSQAVGKAMARHGDFATAHLAIVGQGQYRGAVAVLVDGLTIGHIAHKQSRQYGSVVAELNDLGRPAVVKIWFDGAELAWLQCHPEIAP